MISKQRTDAFAGGGVMNVRTKLGLLVAPVAMLLAASCTTPTAPITSPYDGSSTFYYRATGGIPDPSLYAEAHGCSASGLPVTITITDTLTGRFVQNVQEFPITIAVRVGGVEQPLTYRGQTGPFANVENATYDVTTAPLASGTCFAIRLDQSARNTSIFHYRVTF